MCKPNPSAFDCLSLTTPSASPQTLDHHDALAGSRVKGPCVRRAHISEIPSWSTKQLLYCCSEIDHHSTSKEISGSLYLVTMHQALVLVSSKKACGTQPPTHPCLPCPPSPLFPFLQRKYFPEWRLGGGFEAGAGVDITRRS